MQEVHKYNSYDIIYPQKAFQHNLSFYFFMYKPCHLIMTVWTEEARKIAIFKNIFDSIVFYVFNFMLFRGQIDI